MNNIVTAKLKLPMEFIQNLYNDFNEKTADKILFGMLNNRFVTLRVNTLKSNKKEIINIFEKFSIEYEEVDFYENAFIIKNKNEKNLSEYDFYKNGLVYVQSLSSMIPPLVLDPKPNEKVLDLTSAPGSKTTQMSAMMENKGYILANEIDKFRCEKLKYNVEMQGSKIVEVTNLDGKIIGDKYPEEFDKVLLDTPCSGEGRFLLDSPKSYANWSEKMVNELSKDQKDLINSAYKSLKKDGILVYSTCTLNKKENEQIVDFAVKNLNMQVLDISLDFKEKMNASNKGVNKEIEKAIKILPSKRMEGFFVAKLKK